MAIPEDLKKIGFQYSKFGISENPFKIDPLFRNFHDKKLCIQQEALFVPPTKFKKHLKTLCRLNDRRCLIYGGYGVGKTSMIDLILY